MTFNDKQALFLLWSCIMNQQMKGDTVIRNTKTLMERLGLYDRRDFSLNIDYDALRGAFFQKPQIHRFGETMFGYLFKSIELLQQRYNGKPSLVFNGLTAYSELSSRLSAFAGIGPHKIRVTCEILNAFGYTIPCGGDAKCDSLEAGLPLYDEILNELA